MSFLKKFFGRQGKAEEIKIVSRNPVGKFRVEQSLNVLGKEMLIGEVEGIMYPGYKVKGESVAIIREIQRDRKKVDFAVDGDRVALVLEGKTNAKKGDVLEVYQS
ncbi:tRNA-binding protein Pbp11 [Thermococcus eurythermalis]|uniref:tRNA-binding protein Pbp11 n=1 Tax=Thermococcus eurythermalis TaxID=1505907 RepID=UPI000A70C0A4|nr:tRNA-binding protein Pbp11 [Thermococcus eurythermalis]